MFHVLAYQKSQAAAATLVALTAVPDQQVPQNPSGNFILPANLQLYAATALGATLAQARLNTPSLRSILLPDIYPFIEAAVPPTAPYLDFKYGYGPVIPKNDPVEVDTTNSNGAGVDQEYALLWLGDGNLSVPQGPRFTMHATGTITVGNKVWGAGSITFDQILPYGTFAVVGFAARGANLIAARLVFVGGGWRPGCLAQIAVGDFPNPVFRSGSLGEYGRFESNAPPTVELFGNAAPTTQDFWLDLVKVG